MAFGLTLIILGVLGVVGGIWLALDKRAASIVGGVVIALLSLAPILVGAAFLGHVPLTVRAQEHRLTRRPAWDSQRSRTSGIEGATPWCA